MAFRHATGFVQLQGRLFSFHEKQVVQEVVAGPSGVTRVVNEIQVECSEVNNRWRR